MAAQIDSQAKSSEKSVHRTKASFVFGSFFKGASKLELTTSSEQHAQQPAHAEGALKLEESSFAWPVCRSDWFGVGSPTPIKA